MPNMIQIIKRAALEAVQESNPTNVLFGTVLSTNPMQIKIDQKIVLTKEFLIMSRNVSDYETKMTVNGQDSLITIHNALSTGDEVILLKMQGGQKYVVLDKVGG